MEFRAEKNREFPSTFRSFIATHFILVQLLFMGRRKDACRILAGKPEGNSHLEELGVGGRIVLRLISINRDGSLDCGDMARDGNMYPTAVNAVMNLRVT
jgi:hypothetical protein